MSAPDPENQRGLDDLSDREPVLDTHVLNKMCDDFSAPTPSDFGQRFMERVRANVRARRTESAVAQRISNTALNPVMQSLEEELADSIKQRIENRRRNE